MESLLSQFDSDLFIPWLLAGAVALVEQIRIKL